MHAILQRGYPSFYVRSFVINDDFAAIREDHIDIPAWGGVPVIAPFEDFDPFYRELFHQSVTHSWCVAVARRVST